MIRFCGSEFEIPTIRFTRRIVQHYMHKMRWSNLITLICALTPQISNLIGHQEIITYLDLYLLIIIQYVLLKNNTTTDVRNTTHNYEKKNEHGLIFLT